MESIKSQLEEGDEFVIVEDGKETEFEWRRYLDDQKVNYQFLRLEMEYIDQVSKPKM